MMQRWTKLKSMTWLLASNGLMLVFIWQWIHSAQPITHHPDHYTLEQSPDFTVDGLEYRQYDAQGTLTHRLESPKMHHIPNNDQHVFSHPHVLVTEPKQAPLEIHADVGTAVAKGHTINLDQHVQIKQRKDGAETLLTTEHLSYYPQEKKAVSSAEVTITQGASSHLHAKGMVADLAANHIHLVQARGKHVRSKT